MLEFKQELEKNGYGSEEFLITSGHQDPRFNEQVGGARLSIHLQGEAIDIYVEDINLDGKYTKEDKDIVINILDKKIIRDKGGIGRYPGSRIVHFDVRGYKASVKLIMN